MQVHISLSLPLYITQPALPNKCMYVCMYVCMVIMASGIARGRVRTTATESRNIAAMLSQRNAPLVSSGSMPPFLCGIFKEKKTKDSRGWSNVLHVSRKTKALINRQRSSEIKPRASAGEEGEPVLNNALNYSESEGLEKRRWNNIEQCHEAKLTRAIERQNTRQIAWENYRLSQVKNSYLEMLCSRAWNVTWSVIIRKIERVAVVREIAKLWT